MLQRYIIVYIIKLLRELRGNIKEINIIMTLFVNRDMIPGRLLANIYLYGLETILLWI